MKIITYTQLNQDQKNSILSLWNNEYPKKLTHQSLESFENYLYNLEEPTHYLLYNEEDKIQAWAVTFVRENDIWFAIIVDEFLHGKGFGTQLLNLLKQNNLVLNGWVIDHNNDIKTNGDFYKSPLEFYMKNDFMIDPETRLELDIISAVKIQWKK